MENDVYDIAFEIEMNTGIDISPVIKSQAQYEHWVNVVPFYRNVREEGVSDLLKNRNPQQGRK